MYIHTYTCIYIYIFNFYKHIYIRTYILLMHLLMIAGAAFLLQSHGAPMRRATARRRIMHRGGRASTLCAEVFGGWLGRFSRRPLTCALRFTSALHDAAAGNTKTSKYYIYFLCMYLYIYIYIRYIFFFKFIYIYIYIYMLCIQIIYV